MIVKKKHLIQYFESYDGYEVLPIQNGLLNIYCSKNKTIWRLRDRKYYTSFYIRVNFLVHKRGLSLPSWKAEYYRFRFHTSLNNVTSKIK